MMMSYLNKREWDRRILHVDLRPVLRTGDTPSRLVSVDVEPEPGDPRPVTDLEISDEALDGTSVGFLAAGGTSGRFYRLIIRFEVATQPGQMIEAITGINVG